jgi:hypothetical protein
VGESVETFGLEKIICFDIGSNDPAKPLISDENFLRFMETHNDEELFQLDIKLYDLEIYDKAMGFFPLTVPVSFRIMLYMGFIR